MSHVDESTGGGPPRELTRRDLLGSGLAVAGTVVAVPAPVSGRQITMTAVIPSPEPWADQNLAGFMIHVGGPQDPVETGEAENCDYENWPPEEISAYQAQIINRKDADTPEQEINLHVDATADVPRGALYLINTFERCDNGYVGVSLEQIGRRDVGEGDDNDPVVDVEDDSRPNTQTEGSGAIGPGFGAVGAVAAAVAGGLLARLRNE